MAKWVQLAKKADFKAIGARHGIDQVVARILVNRDITDDAQIEAFLHPSVADFGDGVRLKGMEQAVSFLCEAIRADQKIRIIGDYDVDGVQATYILHQGLMRLGAQADYSIPHRIEDGYGLNKTLIDRCIADGIDLVLTCDNGIAAYDEIAYAKEAGMTVIVTDHHEVPYSDVDGERIYKLPPADAIVNPKQPGCTYGFTKLCGAAVAWKLIQQLYLAMGILVSEADTFLENVAFATVGDVMELVGENRSIVALGLKVLEQTKNLGMRALIEQCELSGVPLSAYHIGFVLGPCINATGRLDTATHAIELLEAENVEQASLRAAQLVQLNAERKNMTEQGFLAAVDQVDSMEHLPLVLVVYLPGVHESIAGIIAGRLRERYERPCFVITDSSEEGILKGSGRSVDGFSMYEEMVKCSELFTKFGGHPMAAGLSILKDNLEAFREAINENTTVKEEEIAPVLRIDVPMPFSYISKELIRQLEVLEPFGNGNSKPVFAQHRVSLHNMRAIGKDKQYLKATAVDSDGGRIEALYFGDGSALAEYARKKGEMNVAYYPQMNFYNGKESTQIIITDYA